MDTLIRRAVAMILTLSIAGLAACTESDEPDSPTGASTGTGAAPAAVESDSSAPPASSFDDVVAAVEDRVAVYDGIATGVIALVRLGDQTEVVTGGKADVGEHLRTDAAQTFPIASLTKSMTATVVLQLVEEGRLALDDRAERWLPELRAAPPITVEQLLSHRSGLSETTESDIRSLGFDTADLVAAAAGRPLEFRPGTDGLYSNIGFAALGLLVERVLDAPLGEVLELQVFEPADMKSSTLFGRPDVQGYTLAGKPVQKYYLELQPGAGSVVATVGDVDAFFHALWQGELLSPPVVDDMRRSRGTVRISDFLKEDYGLGLAEYDFTCGTAHGHYGRIGGFTNEAWTLEGADRSAVVTVNDERADDIARSIIDVALCS